MMKSLKNISEGNLIGREGKTMLDDQYTGENTPEENGTPEAESIPESGVIEKSAAQGSAENSGSGKQIGNTSGGNYQSSYRGSYGNYEYGTGNAVPPAAPKKKNKGVLAAVICGIAVLGCIVAAIGLNFMPEGRRVPGAESRTESPAAADTSGNTEKEEASTASGAETAKAAESAARDSRKKVDLSTAKGTTVVTDVTKVVDKAMPSIVSVYNTFTQDVNFFGQVYSQEGTSTGSGIVIGQDENELLVVTNNHVVAGEEALQVQFIDGSTADARVRGIDAANDLAVIAVDLDGVEDQTLEQITIAELGNSDTLKVGEPAIAIGNALGYGQSVTSGVISALNREIGTRDGESNRFIQTDAAINEGNSGGALLNIDGQVIGINSNKLSGTTVEGMGYAIPISRALPIIQNLAEQETKTRKSAEEQGTIGINGVSVTADVSKAYSMPQGAFVAQILEGGAAEKSDLKKGDIITAINGSTVKDMESLKAQLEYYGAGDTVTLTVQRGDRSGEYTETKVTVTLGSREAVEKAQEERRSGQRTGGIIRRSDEGSSRK